MEEKRGVPLNMAGVNAVLLKTVLESNVAISNEVGKHIPYDLAI